MDAGLVIHSEAASVFKFSLQLDLMMSLPLMM
jgi:hypothetical protein